MSSPKFPGPLKTAAPEGGILPSLSGLPLSGALFTLLTLLFPFPSFSLSLFLSINLFISTFLSLSVYLVRARVVTGHRIQSSKIASSSDCRHAMPTKISHAPLRTAVKNAPPISAEWRRIGPSASTEWNNKSTTHMCACRPSVHSPVRLSVQSFEEKKR